MADPELSEPATSAPGSRIRVWVASAAQLAPAAALLAEFRDWFGRGDPSDGQIRAGVERIAAGGEGEYLVAAASGGEVDGVLQLRYRWSVWKSADDAWIEDLFVRERARGQGLGRALAEFAIERARARGCRRIELDVDEGNAPARALYRELGFADDAKAATRSLLLGRPIDDDR